MLQVTANGIKFTEEITSVNGATITLYPDNHTAEEIEVAKAEIRRDLDVVSMRVASEEDRDYLYKGEYFRIPSTRSLKWYQIEQDEKLIRRERKAGTTPAQFVERYVLPFVAEVEARYLLFYGESMYKF